MRMMSGIMPRPTISPMAVAEMPPEVADPSSKTRGTRCTRAGIMAMVVVEVLEILGCGSDCDDDAVDIYNSIGDVNGSEATAGLPVYMIVKCETKDRVTKNG
jgi:hypothetical protein